MPRYFFDSEVDILARDEIGMEFLDDAGAKIEAIHRAAWFASDVDNLESTGVIVVTVRDEASERVLTVRLVCSVDTAREGF